MIKRRHDTTCFCCN